MATNNIIPESFRAKAEQDGWEISVDEDNNCVTFEAYSSAGQDVSVVIYAADFAELTKELREYYESYDVSTETYLWLDCTGHCKNGAPYDMIDVYRDMEEVCEVLIAGLMELAENELDELAA